MFQINNPVLKIPLTLLLTAFVLSASAQTTPADDEEISTAIEQAYLRDSAIPFNRIDIATEDGIVTLTGRAPNLISKTQAERLAGIVRGVRSVVNLIEVDSIDLEKGELAERVRSALGDDPATDRYEVDVMTGDEGKVTLTGTVESWAERSLAETVAMTVPGVTEIENRLSVQPANPFVDASELADHIKGRMRWDVRVDDSLINVLVREGGHVVLSGTVGSLGEKRQAEDLAHVAGIRSVDSTHLEVKPWALNEDLRRGKYTEKTDEQIREALVRALEYDPRVFDTPINVLVEGGTVWLRGSVGSLTAKRAAENDTLNTVGVNRVFNHLKVRPQILDDGTIAGLIEEGLRGQGLLPSNDITVAVHDRRARLTGDVNSTLAYWRADRVARSTDGLEDLENDLTVRGRALAMVGHEEFGTYPQVTYVPAQTGDALKTDREIYDDIRSELFWSPFVDEDDVTVEVDQGTVTLSGTVDSRHERDLAGKNAFEGGALVVRNDLAIRN